MKYKLICNNRDGECQEPLTIDVIDDDFYVWCEVCQGGTDLKYWFENMARIEATLNPEQTHLTAWVYEEGNFDEALDGHNLKEVKE